MINTRELMIGDKVRIGEKVVVVDEVFANAVSIQGRDSITYAMSIEPITITEEILLNNGFDKRLLIEGNERYDDWVEYEKATNGCFVTLRHCSNTIERDWFVHVDNSYRCGVGGVDIEYVHQLQNFCTLCGFEIDLNV